MLQSVLPKPGRYRARQAGSGIVDTKTSNHIKKGCSKFKKYFAVLGKFGRNMFVFFACCLSNKTLEARNITFLPNFLQDKRKIQKRKSFAVAFTLIRSMCYTFSSAVLLDVTFATIF